MSTKLNANNIKRSIYAPVKRKLFRDLFLVIFSTLLLLLLFGYYFSSQMKKDLAISILDSTTTQVKSNFISSFEPELNSLLINKKWLETNSITMADTDKLNQRFLPLLENSKHVSSIIIASSKGQQYFFYRNDNQWLMRNFTSQKENLKQKSNQLKNNQQVVWTKLDGNGQALESWQETIDYDLKQRPWYKGALQDDLDRNIFITKPYLFFTQNIPGITLSTTYKPSKDKSDTTYIIAVDISLEDISQTLAELKIGENGTAFLLTHEGAVLLANNEKLIYQGSKNRGGFLNLPTDKNHNIIFDAIQNWSRKGKSNTPLFFSVNGQRWWSQFFSLNDKTDKLQAGIVVPERDFIHVLQRNSSIFLPAVILISLFSVLAAWFIVKNNTKRQREVAKIEFESDDFRSELYDVLRRGESETLELKSTMRKNLKSGKHGKEIELAWLKGVVAFLNTSGGILLIGIDDDGVILGLDEDEFENDDRIQLHFKNLISQHIGLEYSKYINFFIEECVNKDDEQESTKKIIVVECKKSDQPAFLYNKNNETFYIRSGPASVSLSISKALKYIQGHKF